MPVDRGLVRYLLSVDIKGGAHRQIDGSGMHKVAIKECVNPDALLRTARIIPAAFSMVAIISSVSTNSLLIANKSLLFGQQCHRVPDRLAGRGPW
jgi:hypothetical protein